MKAFIWDLDGTLLDSYGVITSSAVDALKEHGIAADADELLRYMKNRSLSSWLRKASAEYGIPFERLLGRYGEITHGRDDLITLAPGAAETLRGIREAGGIPPSGFWSAWESWGSLPIWSPAGTASRRSPPETACAS